MSLDYNVYVDCSSQSNGDGSSSANPCSDISCALSLYTGTGNNIIVYIAASTCTGKGNENIIINGTASNYAFIGQGMANSVVIESSLYGNRAFLIENINSITMKNITLRNFFYVPVLNYIVQDGGGAVEFSNLSHVTLENMIFVNNTGLLGGSISLYDIEMTVNIAFCLFEDNIGIFGGGALSIAYSNAIISDSNFSSNTARGDSGGNSEELFYSGSGGAILFYGSDATEILTITGSKFVDNSAFARGGAICYQQSNGSANSISVYSSQFNNNTVFQTFTCASCDTEGGALYIDSRTSYFESTRFYGNFAGLTSNPNSVIDDISMPVLVTLNIYTN